MLGSIAALFTLVIGLTLLTPGPTFAQPAPASDEVVVAPDESAESAAEADLLAKADNADGSGGGIPAPAPPPASGFVEQKMPAPVPPSGDGFQGKAALKQNLLFLALQHSFRMTEEKTTRELRGPFFRDWFDAVKGLHGWKDGGRQFTNYVAHPMQGAIAGWVQIQNDPAGLRQEFGGSGAYWKSRLLKAMPYSAAVSTQFELGPLSQASLGNVGAGIYESKKMGYVDLVITPTLGTVWVVLEDALDKYLLRWVERKTGNKTTQRLMRVLFTPMRSSANGLRMKPLWYRDFRPLGGPG